MLSFGNTTSGLLLKSSRAAVTSLSRANVTSYDEHVLEGRRHDGGARARAGDASSRLRSGSSGRCYAGVHERREAPK